MRPPSGVYFAALLRRLLNTWAMRMGSACMGKGSWGRSTDNSCRPASINGRLVSMATEITVLRSVGSFLSSILPRLTRETSRRSSMSRII